MTTSIRAIGYSDSYQTLTVTNAFASTVTAYLWGGGGGGGASDGGGRGGNGGGGGATTITFSVNTGDVIGIAVGGAGGKSYHASGGGAGTAGGSFTGAVWNSLSLLSLPDVVRNTNGNYCSFLNTYGVWNTNVYDGSFDKTVSVYFPITGNYTFTGSCDNAGYFYLDGVQILSAPGFSTTYSSSVFVVAGYHTVRVYGTNSGGPASIGLTIYSDTTASYSGAVGGNSGGSGRSGGGAGGGGATVLTLNGTVIAVAGGGGGGGGGGQYYFVNECNAPGYNVQSFTSNAGSAGQSFSGDGGGGGGGGGGASFGAGLGGNGGAVQAFGESTGIGGAYGLNYIDISYSGSTALPDGTSPGDPGNPYRTAIAGVGGLGAGPGNLSGNNGNNGYAVFELNIRGTFIKDAGNWLPVQALYAKDAGSWKTVKNMFVKRNGKWESVLGTDNVPPFTSLPSDFGISYRAFGT